MEKKCMYCSKELDDDWKSEWESEIHYKVNTCSCGRKHWVSVSFIGSGHDKTMTEKESIDSILDKGSDLDYAN